MIVWYNGSIFYAPTRRVTAEAVMDLAAAPAYMHPTGPTILQRHVDDRCTHVDDMWGRCDLAPHTYGFHRIEWADGFEARWL